MRQLLIKAALPAALALVAAAPASAKSTGPCAVVTRADATKVLGAKSRIGLIQKFGPVVKCTYATANYRSLTIQVNIVSKAAFEKGVKTDPKPIARVYGIGDEAYSTAGGATLVLWQNGAEVSIDIAAADLKNVPSLEQQVGKAAASRL
jgi:hypothetical protein